MGGCTICTSRIYRRTYVCTSTILQRREIGFTGDQRNGIQIHVNFILMRFSRTAPKTIVLVTLSNITFIMRFRCGRRTYIILFNLRTIRAYRRFISNCIKLHSTIMKQVHLQSKIINLRQSYYHKLLNTIMK